MKNFIITLVISIATLLAGLYLGAKYIGKGEVITALCVMGDVAVKEKYLSKEQFLSLTEDMGRQLKMKYSLLANNIVLSDDSVERASDSSDCSQILVAFTKGANK
jgi:hypothetical protein